MGLHGQSKRNKEFTVCKQVQQGIYYQTKEDFCKYKRNNPNIWLIPFQEKKEQDDVVSIVLLHFKKRRKPCLLNLQETKIMEIFFKKDLCLVFHGVNASLFVNSYDDVHIFLDENKNASSDSTSLEINLLKLFFTTRNKNIERTLYM